MSIPPPAQNSLFNKFSGGGNSAPNTQSLIWKMAFKPIPHAATGRTQTASYLPVSNVSKDCSSHKKNPASHFPSYDENTHRDDCKDQRVPAEHKLQVGRLPPATKYLIVAVFFAPLWILSTCDALASKQCSVFLNGPTTVSTAACVTLGVATMFSTHGSPVKYDLERDKFHVGWAFVNVSLLPKCSGQILDPLLSSIVVLLSLSWGTAIVVATLFTKNSYCKTLAVLIVSSDLAAVVIAAANASKRESAEHCVLLVSSLLLCIGIFVL